MAQNAFLGAFFVTVLGSSWGPPRQAPKMAQNGSLRSLFVTVLGSSWGPPTFNAICGDRAPVGGDLHAAILTLFAVIALLWGRF